MIWSDMFVWRDILALISKRSTFYHLLRGDLGGLLKFNIMDVELLKTCFFGYGPFILFSSGTLSILSGNLIFSRYKLLILKELILCFLSYLVLFNSLFSATTSCRIISFFFSVSVWVNSLLFEELVADSEPKGAEM